MLILSLSYNSLSKIQSWYRRNCRQGAAVLDKESMMEKALERLAEQILSFDEASLASLREKYRLRIENFDGTKEWEKAVIIYYIINGVSMKNALFNENVLKRRKGKEKELSPQGRSRPDLKRVK